MTQSVGYRDGHTTSRGEPNSLRGNANNRSLYAFANSAIVSFSNAIAFFTLLR